MSKAILVMDTPESCRVCPLFERIGTNKYCKLLDEEIYRIDVYAEKPDWCSLKKVPEKYRGVYCDIGFTEGYNACIDEILGGTDV